MPSVCVNELEEERIQYDQAVSKALVKVVIQGLDTDRVTFGIQQCIQLMASGAENIMLCLLIQLSDSVEASMKVPLLLIRAFCQENAINLLHLQGEQKMKELLTSCLDQSAAKCSDDVRTPGPVTQPAEEEESAVGGGGGGGGLGCVMIKYPKGNTSFDDDMIIDYIKDKMKKHTDPAITIPDLSGKDEILGSHFKLKAQPMKTPIQASSQPSCSQESP